MIGIQVPSSLMLGYVDGALVMSVSGALAYAVVLLLVQAPGGGSTAGPGFPQRPWRRPARAAEMPAWPTMGLV